MWEVVLFVSNSYIFFLGRIYLPEMNASSECDGSMFAIESRHRSRALAFSGSITSPSVVVTGTCSGDDQDLGARKTRIGIHAMKGVRTVMAAVVHCPFPLSWPNYSSPQLLMRHSEALLSCCRGWGTEESPLLEWPGLIQGFKGPALLPEFRAIPKGSQLQSCHGLCCGLCCDCLSVHRLPLPHPVPSFPNRWCFRDHCPINFLHANVHLSMSDRCLPCRAFSFGVKASVCLGRCS